MEAEHSKTICQVKLGRWLSLLIFFYIFFRYHSVVSLRNHLSLFLPFISLFTGSCLFVAWLFLVSLKSHGQRRTRGLWISLWWTLLSQPWWFTWTQMPSCGWSTPFPYWYSTPSVLPFDAKIQILISLFECLCPYWKKPPCQELVFPSPLHLHFWIQSSSLYFSSLSYHMWNFLKVVEHFFYFIRQPGAIITEETFNRVVHFGNVCGDPVKRLLIHMTWLHAPAVALTTFKDKTIKDNYHYHLHDLLAFLTGAYLRGKTREKQH